jgi:hypothetical protein
MAEQITSAKATAKTVRVSARKVVWYLMRFAARVLRSICNS